MTNQPTLPYVKGSETSQAAAESMKEAAPAIRVRVYQYLLTRGEQGAIDEEVIAALGGKANSIRPRRGDLVDMGAVRKSGRTRPTISGRSAVVWVAVPDMDVTVRRGRKPMPAGKARSRRINVHLTRKEYKAIVTLAAAHEWSVQETAYRLIRLGHGIQSGSALVRAGII